LPLRHTVDRRDKQKVPKEGTAYTNHQVVGSKTLNMTPALQTVTIVGLDIKRVSIDVQGVNDFVIDDLQWR